MSPGRPTTPRPRRAPGSSDWPRTAAPCRRSRDRSGRSRRPSLSLGPELRAGPVQKWPRCSGPPPPAWCATGSGPAVPAVPGCLLAGPATRRWPGRTRTFPSWPPKLGRKLREPGPAGRRPRSGMPRRQQLLPRTDSPSEPPPWRAAAGAPEPGSGRGDQRPTSGCPLCTVQCQHRRRPAQQRYRRRRQRRWPLRAATGAPSRRAAPPREAPGPPPAAAPSGDRRPRSPRSRPVAPRRRAPPPAGPIRR